MLGGDGRRAQARLPDRRNRPAEGRPRGRAAARALRPDAVEIHHAAETSGDDAVAACNALGLFAGEGRLIVVDGVEAWKADDAKEIAAYLKAPAPATTLALVGGELKKDAPIAKAVAAGKGELLLWDVPQKALQRWVAEQFALHGDEGRARGLPGAARARRRRPLRALVRDRQARDLGRRRPVTAADVERLVAARAETTNFALTDAWGARDVVGVLHASEGLLERSGDPRSRTIPRVVGILTSHVARIRRVQALEAQGVAAKDAAVTLKRHPYYVGKLYAQGRNYTPDELAHGDGPARRARPRAQGRLAARRRPRARARADRDHRAAQLTAAPRSAEPG